MKLKWFFITLFVYSSSLFAANNSLQLTKKVMLKNGNTAYVYNQGSQVIVKNAQGKVQQTSCFNTCSVPLKTAIQFLKVLQTAIKQNDENTIAQLLVYPLQINSSALKINSAADLREYYTQLFTPELQQVILQQEPYSMYATMQGVMLGSGQLWFNIVPNLSTKASTKILITVINL